MQTHMESSAEKSKQSNLQPAQLQTEPQSAFDDNRAEMAQLKAMQPMMSVAPQNQNMLAMQAIMNNSSQTQNMQGLQMRMSAGALAQRQVAKAAAFMPVQRMEEDEPLQAQLEGETMQREVIAATPPEPIAEAPKSNNTGLPNQLKTGIESLSGMSMDHVKVHYNSDKPAQLQAHAYAQGSEIHVAPGQEQHLPHEAWHVVQQAQGRVRPTVQMKGGVQVNDDVGLEGEADVMGAKALQMKPSNAAHLSKIQPNSDLIQYQAETDHVEADGRISFYRFGSVNTENFVAATRDAAKASAVTRLGSTGKKKLDRVLAGVDNQRDGNYTVYENNAETDKVLVEHTADDNATLTRYYNWRRRTEKGNRDRFDTVRHFHAATIPKIAGDNRKDWRDNLTENTFPAYTAVGGDHHFYYIDHAAPTTASGFIDIPEDEVDN